MFNKVKTTATLSLSFTYNFCHAFFLSAFFFFLNCKLSHSDTNDLSPPVTHCVPFEPLRSSLTFNLWLSPYVSSSKGVLQNSNNYYETSLLPVNSDQTSNVCILQLSAVLFVVSLLSDVTNYMSIYRKFTLTRLNSCKSYAVLTLQFIPFPMKSE